MALLPGGKTHKGGNSKGTCTLGSISPPVTGQPTTGQPATGHSPSGQEDIIDQPLVITGHQSNGHYTGVF